MEDCDQSSVQAQDDAAVTAFVQRGGFSQAARLVPAGAELVCDLRRRQFPSADAVDRWANDGTPLPYTEGDPKTGFKEIREGPCYQEIRRRVAAWKLNEAEVLADYAGTYDPKCGCPDCQVRKEAAAKRSPAYMTSTLRRLIRTRRAGVDPSLAQAERLSGSSSSGSSRKTSGSLASAEKSSVTGNEKKRVSLAQAEIPSKSARSGEGLSLAQAEKPSKAARGWVGSSLAQAERPLTAAGDSEGSSLASAEMARGSRGVQKQQH